MSTVEIWTLRSFRLSSSVQVLPFDVTTPRDSYAWNYRELATVLILSESLAKGGFESMTIGSMRKNLTIELSRYPMDLESLEELNTNDDVINACQRDETFSDAETKSTPYSYIHE